MLRIDEVRVGPSKAVSKSAMSRVCCFGSIAREDRARNSRRSPANRCCWPISQHSVSTNRQPPTHYEPRTGVRFSAIRKLGSLRRLAVFGWTLAWRPAADFGTASPCGNRLYGRQAECVRELAKDDCLTKKAGHSSSSLDSRCRGNCPTTLTPTLSNCSPQRTLPVPAVCRAERSTERLRGASCGRLGFATDSGSSPASWSVGSGSRPLPLIPRSGPRDRQGRAGLPAAACALCSTRRATDRRAMR